MGKEQGWGIITIPETTAATGRRPSRSEHAMRLHRTHFCNHYSQFLSFGWAQNSPYLDVQIPAKFRRREIQGAVTCKRMKAF